MNRQDVLHCIQLHLGELSKSNAKQPLGELITPIARELRANFKAEGMEHRVVPIQLVSAFVDGVLSVEEERIVLEAILIDNSVLAEIIASVRSKQEYDDLDEVPTALTRKLLDLAMQQTNFAQSKAKGDLFEKDSIAARVVLLSRQQPVSRQHNRTVWAVGLVASVSATIILAFVLWNRPEVDHGKSFVENEDSSSGEPEELEGSQEKTRKASVPDSDMVVESPTPKTDVSIPELKKDTTKSGPNLVVSQPPPSVPSTNTDQPEMKSPESLLSQDPKSTKLEEKRITGVRWSKIHGVLVSKEVRDSESDPGYNHPWQGREVGKVDWKENFQGEVTYCTFALSRAEASLETGGKLVLDAESMITISNSKPNEPFALDLTQGGTALVDFPKGMTLEIRSAMQHMATIEWTAKSTVLLAISPQGLQVQVRGDGVIVDGRKMKDEILAFSPEGVQDATASTKQLPAWVSRQTETNPVSKAVLAQISSSRDVESTIRQLTTGRMSRLDDATIGWLDQWLGGSNQFSLYENLKDIRPLTRASAWRLLIRLPNWNREVISFWRSIELGQTTPDRTQILKQSMATIRRGERLTNSQAMQVVYAMETNDITARSLGDFILRSIMKGAPVYEPHTLDQQSQTRMLGLWRRFINANLR